ncbi:uncharacterized protein LOC110024103 [Phalaenopsis equestris]|uniref:uncharacterized protein LOC110024103 n=1 Tax=Phalaenopsis equestris TaxID=78828 RepID=UPI0009E51D7C|nr:uncharacterized protein LOC110024103 [Phalaenopsis equestris]
MEAQKVVDSLESQNNCGSDLVEDLAYAHKTLLEVISLKESMLKQKANDTLFADEDINTNYFHATFKHKRNMNVIFKIKDINRGLIPDSKEIGMSVVHYFTGLFDSTLLVPPVESYLFLRESRTRRTRQIEHDSTGLHPRNSHPSRPVFSSPVCKVDVVQLSKFPDFQSIRSYHQPMAYLAASTCQVRRPLLTSAGSRPPPSQPSSEANFFSGLRSMFARAEDGLRIFFAVLFWMSLFFWGSAWEGGDDGRKRGLRKRR